MGHLNEKHTWFNLENNERCVMRYTTTDGEMILLKGMSEQISEHMYGLIVFKKPIERIENSMFENISNLKTVTLPEGVQTIAQKAFNRCTNLETINIPNSVTEIGSGAFEKCPSLKNYDDIRYADTCAVKAQNYDIVNARIKNGTRFICSNAFIDCVNLKNVTIPETVISIGSSAFYGCEKLSQINISKNKITSIKANTFRECYNLQEIIIPKTVKIIGSRAFYFCKSLRKVYMPKSVEYIGERAFSDCKNMQIFYEGSQEDFENIHKEFLAVRPNVNIKYNQKF